MGQCCKCGKETKHAYTYWTGDLLAKKTCVNAQKHTAFLCARHVIAERVIVLSVFSALYLVLIADRALSDNVSVMRIIFPFGLMAALIFGTLLYLLLAIRRDKKIPLSGIEKARAERCIVKVMRKQNPDIAYLTVYEYEKRIGGITP